jgi:hypothetical protein
MSKIECEIDLVMLEDERGIPVPGVRATCTACGHSTESFGDGPRSVKRCLCLLREECPMGESNWYAAIEEVIDKRGDENPYDDIPF